MSSPVLPRFPQITRGEAGMTIIEVIVAALILSVGILSLLTAFNGSRRVGTSAEEHQTAASIAQGELQRIQALPWAQIALTAEPTKSSGATTTDPTYYEVSGTCAGSTGAGPVSSPCYQWDWNGTAGATTTTEPLVVCATSTSTGCTGVGDSTADPTAWSTTVTLNGSTVRLSGEVYRFITWVNDPNCSSSSCGGTNDDKRVLVAVTGTGLDKPVVLTTLVTNPVASSADPLYNNNAECLDGTATVQCIG